MSRFMQQRYLASVWPTHVCGVLERSWLPVVLVSPAASHLTQDVLLAK